MSKYEQDLVKYALIKEKSHLVLLESGLSKTQVVCCLFRRDQGKIVKDRVIPKKFLTQDNLLVWKLELRIVKDRLQEKVSH